MRHLLRAAALCFHEPRSPAPRTSPCLPRRARDPDRGPRDRGRRRGGRASGKIVAVGPQGSTPVPAGAIRARLSRASCSCPASWTPTATSGARRAPTPARRSSPTCACSTRSTSATRGIQKAQAGGITTVNVMPGSGHLLSGQTVYVKLRDGKRTIDDLLIPNPETGLTGGMKMANGTNSRRKPPVPRHPRQVRGPRARAVRQGPGVPAEDQGRGRRSEEDARPRSRPRGARRGARRQAHRPPPHPPPRRHRSPCSGSRRSSASAWCCTT